jgi:hypothetical protein
MVVKEVFNSLHFFKIIMGKRQFDNGVKIRAFFIAIDENIMYDAWYDAFHCFCWTRLCLVQQFPE